MTKTIKTLLLLKMNYLINGIFYYLKKMPLIKKIVPDFLRDSGGLKTVITIVSQIVMLLKSVLFKMIYQAVFIIMPLTFAGELSIEGALHILVFTAVIGSAMNNKYFEMNMPKYYGIVLLRMDAKGYYIGDYLYSIFELYFGYIVGNALLILLFPKGIFLPTSQMLALSLIIPTFTVLAKNIYIDYKLSDFIKKGVFNNDSSLTLKSVVLLLAMIAATYLPVYFGYPMPIIAFIAVAATFLILNIKAINGIRKFTEYTFLTKQLYFGNLAILTRSTAGEMIKESYQKQIDLNTEITSEKRGHAYLNEIFIKRHKKVLTNSARMISIGAAVVFLAGVIFATINSEFAAKATEVILNNLPIMLFIIYFLNRGQSITQSMYINCDSALLCYNFYKKPSAILGVFIERLRSVVIINMIPAAVIGFGLAMVLAVSGIVTNPLIYLVIIVSVVAMSVFFSVHYLALYYLFQPFSSGLTVKNPIYAIISAATYLVCWQFREVELDTLLFGAAIVIFTVVYIIIAMILVYKFAPKTFKLK